MFAPMKNRVTRRRESLYTVEEMAREMGVGVDVVHRLEEDFFTPEQRAYLNVVRYEVGFYPRRKKSRANRESSGDSFLEGTNK